MSSLGRLYFRHTRDGIWDLFRCVRHADTVDAMPTKMSWHSCMGARHVLCCVDDDNDDPSGRVIAQYDELRRDQMRGLHHLHDRWFRSGVSKLRVSAVLTDLQKFQQLENNELKPIDLSLARRYIPDILANEHEQLHHALRLTLQLHLVNVPSSLDGVYSVHLRNPDSRTTRRRGNLAAHNLPHRVLVAVMRYDLLGGCSYTKSPTERQLRASIDRLASCAWLVCKEGLLVGDIQYAPHQLLFVVLELINEFKLCAFTADEIELLNAPRMMLTFFDNAQRSKALRNACTTVASVMLQQIVELGSCPKAVVSASMVCPETTMLRDIGFWRRMMHFGAPTRPLCLVTVWRAALADAAVRSILLHVLTIYADAHGVTLEVVKKTMDVKFAQAMIDVLADDRHQTIQALLNVLMWKGLAWGGPPSHDPRPAICLLPLQSEHDLLRNAGCLLGNVWHDDSTTFAVEFKISTLASISSYVEKDKPNHAMPAYWMALAFSSTDTTWVRDRDNNWHRSIQDNAWQLVEDTILQFHSILPDNFDKIPQPEKNIITGIREIPYDELRGQLQQCRHMKAADYNEDLFTYFFNLHECIGQHAALTFMTQLRTGAF